MRKEIFGIGSYVHVVNRGTRSLPIVRDDIDRFRFLLMLSHFNDHFAPLNWYRDLQDTDLHNSLSRPNTWPPQERLVNIIAFCLVENHFHLLLQELTEGGVPRFMQRLGTGMAKRFNERHGQKGSLFEGPYRARLVSDDRYFRYVTAYIQVKNAFDVHPRGYVWARDHFDEAYNWATRYSYSSLGDYIGIFGGSQASTEHRAIVEREFLSSLFSPDEYREYSRDMILGRLSSDDEIKTHISGFFK